MWRYKIEAGIHEWNVYRRAFFWPFYEMFAVASFQYKRDAEQWIKEQG